MKLNELKDVLVYSQVIKASFVDESKNIKEFYLKASELNDISISDYDIQVMYLSDYDKLIHVLLSNPVAN